ncbi:hypothetical protein [Microbacterium azadirachtae]|uniref:hypothetical protein n=1 Tax=Microbacterium azadirachtae TaxID=582680 RepID=UPI000882B910|nr:hypothetical protein [Microbacterium azadirachtae]SDL21748.1 hypothetical protein SAMN04488593_0339 [Microbacterium azadirachtae]SEF51766.1 hypothetical protein SAMN04488594_0329 [Microbacterium azadirachtae]SEF51878.1 hypothetical protein SAMN04488592_0338 [Microbacterium azadirachtae]
MMVRGIEATDAERERANARTESVVLKTLSSLVLDAAKSTEGIVLRSNYRTPMQRSILDRAFTEAKVLNATGHLTDAVLQAEYGMLSAVDHARAFATLIRSGLRHSTALFTLTRGTLEALARPRWIMHDLDFLQLAHRSLSLLYSDLRYPERLGELLVSRDGEDVDPGERRRHHESDLERLGLPRPIRVDSSMLVSELVDSDLAHQDGKRLYSLLSAVAHGHRFAVNAFIRTSEDNTISGLSPTLPIVTEFAFQIAVTLISTTEAMVRWYGDPSDERSRIDATWTRFGARLDTLPTEAFGQEEL